MSTKYSLSFVADFGLDSKSKLILISFFLTVGSLKSSKDKFGSVNVINLNSGSLSFESLSNQSIISCISQVVKEGSIVCHFPTMLSTFRYMFSQFPSQSPSWLSGNWKFVIFSSTVWLSTPEKIIFLLVLYIFQQILLRL